MYDSVPDLPAGEESVVVPGWRPALQNHAVTGYAALFAGFEKTTIPFGFKGYVYEVICDYVMVKIVVQTIKYLQGLPKKLRDSIRSAITGLTKQPPKGDIKSMQGYKDGRHRLRVGKYRVIYRYSQDVELDILIIMEIGSRGIFETMPHFNSLLSYRSLKV